MAIGVKTSPYVRGHHLFGGRYDLQIVEGLRAAAGVRQRIVAKRVRIDQLTDKQLEPLVHGLQGGLRSSRRSFDAQVLLRAMVLNRLCTPDSKLGCPA